MHHHAMRGTALETFGGRLDRLHQTDRLQVQLQRARLDAGHVEEIADQVVQPPGFVGDDPQGCLGRLAAPGPGRAAREDRRDRRPQVVRDVGQQLPPVAVALAEGSDLLLGAGEANRSLRRHRLLAVEPDQVRVRQLQLLAQAFRRQPSLAPPPLQQADQDRGAEEEDQIDQVVGIGDRQRVPRCDEEEVHQEEAQRGRQEPGPERAQEGDQRRPRSGTGRRSCATRRRPAAASSTVSRTGAAIATTPASTLPAIRRLRSFTPSTPGLFPSSES